MPDYISINELPRFRGEPQKDEGTGRFARLPTIDDVRSQAEAKGIDPDFAASIFAQESGSNPNVRPSPRGAIGGMQVMPGTFRAMMPEGGDITNPWDNIEAGLRYIQYGQKKLNTKDARLLAAGYHQGYDRPELQRGEIAATSDGLISTPDYARSIVARMGTRPAATSSSTAAPAAPAGTAPDPATPSTPSGRIIADIASQGLTLASPTPMSGADAARVAEGKTPEEWTLGKEWQYQKANLKIGLNNLVKGFIHGRELAEWGDLIASGEEKYTPEQIAADPKLRAEMDLRRRKYDETLAKITTLSDENAKLFAETSPAVQKLFSMKGRDWSLDTLSEIGGVVATNPRVIVDIATQSGPASAAMLASAVMARFAGMPLTGSAIAGGAASGMVEFGSDYVENREKGIPHEEAYRKAVAKAGIVGMFDAASLSSAGKAMGDVFSKAGVGRKTWEAVKELGRQAGYGMAGEAGGSLAAGETPDPVEVAAEGLGELATGPAEMVSLGKKPKPAAAAGTRAPLAEAGEPVRAEDIIARPAAPASRGIATIVNQGEQALTEPVQLTTLDRVNAIDAKVRELSAKLDPAQPDAAVSDEVARLRAERDTLTKSWPKLAIGKPVQFATESGVDLSGQYALAEADDLVSSHDVNLRQNPAFPQELQPRERERAASELQVSNIVQKLNPARLGESPDVANGAPIIGSDGLVESGNARTIALKRVYQSNGEKAERYRAWLKENADRFGFSADQIEGMQAPVLVRVRETPVNRAEFARQANAPTTAQMSPLEQARSDAARISTLDDFTPSETGDFAGADNRRFVERFIGGLPVTEQAALVTANGQLSQAGYARVRNAVLARAYGDSPVLMRMVESLDNNLRNVTAALVRVAPAVAKARESIADGALHDRDITADVLSAVEELSRLRTEGKSVVEYLAQSGMFGDKLTPEAAGLLQFLDENIRSPRRVAALIENYLTALASVGSPNQGTLLGETEAPSKQTLIQSARERTAREFDDAEGVRSGEAPAGEAAAADADQAAGEGARRAAEDAIARAKGEQRPDGAGGARQGDEVDRLSEPALSRRDDRTSDMFGGEPVEAAKPASEDAAVKAAKIKDRQINRKAEKNPIPKDDTLTGEKAKVQERFREWMWKHLEEAIVRYQAANGNTLNTDEARKLSEDYNRSAESRSRLAAAVHETSSWLVKEIYRRELEKVAPDGKADLVTFTAGGTGAGKSTAIKAVPRLRVATDLSQIVFDTNMNGTESAAKKIDQALAAGKKVGVVYVYRPLDKSLDGALGRAMNPRSESFGRSVPLAEHVRTHVGARKTILELAERYKGDDRVEFGAIDNGGVKGEEREVSLDKLPPIEYNDDVRRHLERSVEKAHSEGRISDALLEGTLGRKPRQPAQPGAAQGTVPPDHGRDGRKPAAGAREEVDGSRPVQDRRGGAAGQESGAGAQPQATRAARRVRRDEGQGDFFGDRDEAPGGARAGEVGRPAADGAGAEPEVGGGVDQGTGVRRDAGVPRLREKSGRNWRASDSDLTYEGSWLDKARANLEAVRLLKQLEAENRQATPDEQRVLAKYVGWGAGEIRNKVFAPNAQYSLSGSWAQLYRDLKDLLTPEEWQAASRSTQYAHYTSKPVVRAIWNGVSRLGFKGGQVLEPGAGIGVFPGLMPSEVAAQSSYTGIEFDPITGGILKQLFPDERIAVESYVDSKLPRDFYDVAIGNPPFASTPILSDQEYRKQAFVLHDYFFAKTLDRVKPGGLVVFVTSRYTMDKGDDKARAYMADRADLVGAVRLPQTAFQKNAGTEVVTDVIFLRKKVPGQTWDGAQAWAKTDEVKTDQGPARINEYFAAHPEMVLGKHALDRGMYQDKEYTVLPAEGDIEAQFADAIARLPADVFNPTRGSDAERAKVQALDFDPKVQKEGNYYVGDGGRLMVRDGGVGVPVPIREGNKGSGFTAKQVEIIKDFVKLRDALKAAQSDQLNDGPWEKSLQALRAEYKRFTGKHGHVNQSKVYERARELVDEDTGKKSVETEASRRFPLLELLREDPDYSLVMALEKVNEETGAVSESPFLKDRVLNKPKQAIVRSPSDALLASLNQSGRVDVDEMGRMLGADPAQVVEALGPAVYEDPSAGWVTADAYLSGDVKDKLAKAQAAAKSDKRFERNVEALMGVQPAQIAASDITATIGMNWIDPKVYEQFLRETAGVSATITHVKATGAWMVKATSGYASTRATQDWGTARRPAGDLMDDALNSRQIKVFDTDPQTKKRELNPAATEEANAKLAKLRDEFKSWIWRDGDRAAKLVAEYNERFNRIVPRSFDGRHLTLPGTSAKWKVHDHVKRGAWRIVQTGNTYLAHAVGAGKTFASVIAGMEQKRLGLINKPMYVVPNHMLQQFAREFLDLYPAARIMVADEKNFHTENRRRFVSRVALSDLDGVIITHSAFGLLDLDPAFKAKLIEQELEYFRAVLEEAGGDPDNMGHSRDPKIRNIEAAIEKMEQRLAAAADGSSRDKNVRFDELGVDMLFVDEAHEFRKLAFASNRQVKGIDTNGSNRAFDLWMKTRWLEQKSPGRSLVMMSGTPVTNTLAELYTVQRYLAPDVLEERGIERFDSWAAMFGEEVTEIEADASGRYMPVTRFAKFQNVPELTQMFREFADVLTSTTLGQLLADTRPKVKGGSRNLVVTPETPEFSTLKAALARRLEASRKWKPTRDEPFNPDPIIRIIGDGRLASIDHRFAMPGAKSNPDSKLNQLIAGVIKVYRETSDMQFKDRDGNVEKARGATQMVFSDVGLGEGVAEARGFNARAWLKKSLVDAGIPSAEIAFMSDYKKSEQKLRLFQDMNSGKVRVLIGSSKNMGTGVNAQQRLYALHHLDTPWYPADLEQREGRIIRHGNKNREVEIYAYSTKGSYDTVMWQMLASKQRFIDQALSGDSTVRSLDDLTEAGSYQMATAMTAGDQRAVQLAGLNAEIGKLSRLQQAHLDSQVRMRNALDLARSQSARAAKDLADAEAEAKKVQDLSGDKFRMTLGRSTFDTRKDAGEALIERAKSLATQAFDGEQKIGEISGFPIFFFGRIQKDTKDKVIGYRSAIGLGVGEHAQLLEHEGADPVGLMMSMQNRLENARRRPDELRQTIADAKGKIADLQGRIGAPFEFDRLLADKRAEANALEREMVADSTAPAGAQQALPEPGAAPAASRGARATGTPVEELERALRPIIAGDKNLPVNGVNILSDVSKLPPHLLEFAKKQGADADMEGIFDPATKAVYLIANHIETPERATFVLFHELYGHYGLRGLFGRSLDSTLQHIYNSNRNVRAEATRLKNKYGYGHMLAIEEALSNLAGRGETFGGLRRLMVEIQNWLRAHGFAGIADWIEGLSDAEALGVIAESKRFVQGREPKEPAPYMPDASAALLRATARSFGEWFRGAKIVNEDGSPKVMYRGEWSGKPGRNPFVNTSYIAGTPTFTDNPRVASAYAESPNYLSFAQDQPVERQRVGMYYLAIKNPIALNDGEEDVTEYGWLRKQLKVGDKVTGHEFRSLLRNLPPWRYDGEDIFVDEFRKENPDKADYVYIDSYEIANREEFVTLARKAGYDGVTYYGPTDGETAWEVRPFSASQVRAAFRPDSALFARSEEGGPTMTPPAAGEPFLVYRVGQEKSLENRNAGNAASVARHLMAFDDFEAPSGQHIGDTIAVYEVTADGFGQYQGLRAGAQAEGSQVGRSVRGTEVAYSFPKGGGWKAKLVASVPLADVRARLRAAGYESFDDAGTAIGARVIREATDEAVNVDRGAALSRRDDPTSSAAFKRWFGKSKVVDRKGQPVVVYHGSKAGAFKAFDFGRAADGAPFFSSDEEHAAFFGKPRAFYLSISNPLSISQKDLEAAWDRDHAEDGEPRNSSARDLPREYVQQFVEQAKKAGHDGLIIRSFDDVERTVDVFLPFAPEQIKSATDNRGTFDPGSPNILFSRGQTVDERADEIMANKTARIAPLEAVTKAAVKAVRLDRVTSGAYDYLLGLLNRVTPEKVKAGLVADYGIPEAVIDRRVAMQGKVRSGYRQVESVLAALGNLTRAESRVAYEWMNANNPEAAEHFRAQLPEESIRVLADVERTIDQLSGEAMRLGQISAESRERNRFAYMRRSYAKHTAELTPQQKANRSKAVAVLGDQYKGRGIVDGVEMNRVQAAAPEWWRRKLVKGKADTALKGESFIRLEKRSGVSPASASLDGMPEGGEQRRLEAVQYWPAGEPIPTRFAAWEQSGTWQVRDVRGGKLILWRDFTKAEREKMGELDEVKYAVAKTLHGMIHDIEVGKYLEWIGTHHARKTDEGIADKVVEAKEGLRTAYEPGTWVKVPETEIPGTGGVKRYGLLSGRFVPAPIWNDIRQTVNVNYQPFGEIYAKLLSAWKVSKTALSPAVHTNNVMSNFVMADWHDVQAPHLFKALDVLVHQKDAANAKIVERFEDAGGTIGSFSLSELQREQLEPLLDELRKEIQTADDGAGMVGVAAALQLALSGKMREAIAAGAASKTAGVIGKAGKAMIDLYQSEDVVFRLAAFLRAKEEGATDAQAAKVARRSFLDYHINAPWVQMMRSTAFPFVSFTYRAAPMLLEVAARKPWKLLKLGLAAGALNALGYALSGGDEDRERKLLSDEKRGRIFGFLVPKLIRMPWNDANGSPVFMDVRRWIPVGDIFDLGQSHAAVPVLPVATPGGPLALLGELLFNKSQFTGKAITKETDTIVEKAAAVADHLWKAVAPNLPFLPGTYSFTSLKNAASGRTDAFGREQNLGQAAVSTLGVKVGSYPADVLRQQQQRRHDAQIREITERQTALRRELVAKGISPEKFAEGMAEQNRKKERAHQELAERLR